MFEQTILETLIVIGMFVLRIGVPIAILFGLAKWLEKKLRLPETQETEQRTAGAQIILFARPRSHARPQTTTRASEDDMVKRANVK